MRQKLITLCPTSFELAGKKANFSAWVRKKLLEEVKQADIKYEYLCNMCGIHTYRSRSYVKGILRYVDCIECGAIAMSTGREQE